MDVSIAGESTLPSEEQQLDQEIEGLQTQIRRLKRHLAHHTTNILSSSNLISIPHDNTPLAQTSEAQDKHNAQILYRACASITTFRVQDPDPYAVDSGRILGLRIESFSPASGRYQRPYYVFLNKPYSGHAKELLRIHRHTLPPAVNIAELAKRYLPTPKHLKATEVEVAKVGRQNLGGFVRALRKEIAGFGNRGAVVKGMRKKFGLDRKVGMDTGSRVEDVSAVDAEVKQIRIEWDDGRIGRVVMDSKGEVQDCAIFGDGGRDKAAERRVLGGSRRIENVVDDLLEV